VLRELDFTVIVAVDADKTAFDQKLREFARALRTARTGVFFYAGHGLQVAGKNYAVPVDAKLESAADLQVEAVDVDRVLASMQADDNRVSLVFLDACRDNPLTRTFARALPPVRAVSVGHGLSAVEAGRGTLIAFATAPNKIALDGQERNSPFTRALLRHIRTPGLDIAFVMRRVTADVEAATSGAQVPWVHASLTTDVMLKRGEATATPPVPAPGPGADEVAWSFVKDSKDIEQLRRFLRQFPASARKAEAELLMARLSPPQSRPVSDIPAPNEPLPQELPLDPDILRLAQTHPFFANAPAVLIASHDITTNSSSTVNGFHITTTSDDHASIRWLRPGIIRSDSAQHSTQTNTGSPRNDLRGTSIAAGNGFISLSYKGTGNMATSFGPMSSLSTSKLLQIDNLVGSIFPIAIGNRFSYRLVYQTTTVTKGRYSSNNSDEHTIDSYCEVAKKYEAKSFHLKLTGSAFLVTCSEQNAYKKNRAANGSGQSKILFFADLGAWIRADPVFPREALVQTYFDGNAKEITVLKSFMLAR
jgi:hypothetical protein